MQILSRHFGTDAVCTGPPINRYEEAEKRNRVADLDFVPMPFMASDEQIREIADELDADTPPKPEPKTGYRFESLL